MNKWFIFLFVFSSLVKAAEPALPSAVESCEGMPAEICDKALSTVQNYEKLFQQCQKFYNPNQRKIIQQYISSLTILSCYKKPQIYLAIEIYNDAIKKLESQNDVKVLQSKHETSFEEEQKNILLIVDSVEKKIKDFYLKITGINIDKCKQNLHHVQLAYNQFLYHFYMLLLQDAVEGQDVQAYQAHIENANSNTVVLESCRWQEKLERQGYAIAQNLLRNVGVFTEQNFAFCVERPACNIQQQPWFTNMATLSPEYLGGKEVAFLKLPAADLAYKIVQRFIPPETKQQPMYAVAFTRYLLLKIRAVCEDFFDKNLVAYGCKKEAFWKDIKQHEKDLLSGCQLSAVSYMPSTNDLIADSYIGFVDTLSLNLAKICLPIFYVKELVSPVTSSADEFQNAERNNRTVIVEEEKKDWRLVLKNIKNSVVAYYKQQADCMLQSYQEYGNQGLQPFTLLYHDFEQHKKRIQDKEVVFKSMLAANARFAQIKTEREHRVNAIKDFQQQCVKKSLHWQQCAKDLVQKMHACKLKYVESEFAAADLFGVKPDTVQTVTRSHQKTQTTNQCKSTVHKGVQTMVQHDPKDDVIMSLRKNQKELLAEYTGLKQGCASMNASLKKQEQDFAHKEQEIRNDVSVKMSDMEQSMHALYELVQQSEQATQQLTELYAHESAQKRQSEYDNVVLSQELEELKQDFERLYVEHQALLHHSNQCEQDHQVQQQPKVRKKKRYVHYAPNVAFDSAQEPNSRRIPPQATALPEYNQFVGHRLVEPVRSMQNLQFTESLAFSRPELVPAQSPAALAAVPLVTRHNPYQAVVWSGEHTDTDGD